MDQEIIAELESSMKRRQEALPGRIRPYSRAKTALPRAFVLSGPRGVGKTTFLLHHARDQSLLYLAADNPRFAGDGLYDIGKALFMAGYEGLIVDEVHHARDWSLHLKALFDDFPKHRIWVGDSSSLMLRSGVGDLSRRYVPIAMPLLSFREYLESLPDIFPTTYIFSSTPAP
jgi:predicted AAA+ superfamily ATPase